MKKIFIIIFVIFSFILIFLVWEKNYLKQKEIKINLVEKPNFLPSKNYLKNTSFWFKNLLADYYWLQLIQYIWGNAITSSYKEYLFTMLDLITELNPFFVEPYVIWELLLPSYNERYENLSKEEQEKNKKDAVKIWLKWIKNFCDAKKIKIIEKEDNLEKLFSDEKYKNPCFDYQIPYNLAFVYYFYIKDFKNSEKFYKVASVTDWVPEWAKNLISIIKWKWWNREKSFFMFLNMANYTANWNQVCEVLSKELKNIWEKIFFKNKNLNWDLLKIIEKTRSENIFEDEKWFSSSSCGTFLNKSIRELNVFYLENANQKYKEKFGKNSSFPKDLLKAWFIDYIPVDYQQEKDYWIIYFFDEKLGIYDYKMWRYE